MGEGTGGSTLYREMLEDYVDVCNKAAGFRAVPRLSMRLMKAMRTHRPAARASPGVHSLSHSKHTIRPDVVRHDRKTPFGGGGERETLCEKPSMSPSFNHSSSQPT